jgi:integrase
MSSETKFIDPFRAADTLSLAEALCRVEGDPAVESGRKSRVRAAVAMTGRLLHKPPQEIPASRTLVRQLRRLRRGPTGLEKSTVSNCISEIRFLLDAVCLPGGRSPFAPLTNDWANLRDGIEVVWDQHRLSRLMSYASANGITSAQVDDAVMTRFGEALAASGEVDDPRQTVRIAIKAWNRVAAMPERCLATLRIETAEPKRWTIKPDQFPEGFCRDVERWLERISIVDPESEEGPIRPLRPATVRLHKQQIFTAASALVFSGHKVEDITELATLVEIEAFKSLMRWLRERHGGKTKESLYKLAATLTAIARHHVGVDGKHLDRLKRICANFNPGHTGFRTRTRTRLSNFEDAKVLAALCVLSTRLIEEAMAPRTQPRTAKALAQVAVAVEFLWFAPLRCGNLAALNLNNNIKRVTVGRETRWIVTFQREETKNRELLNYELPAAAVLTIERALRLYDQPDGWLFPDRHGGRKTARGLGAQIKRVVEQHIGVPFNTHLFRAITGTLVVKADPNGFETARALLGNRSERVVREHYTATAERHLISRAQDSIQKMRMRAAPFRPDKG